MERAKKETKKNMIKSKLHKYSEKVRKSSIFDKESKSNINIR